MIYDDVVRALGYRPTQPRLRVEIKNNRNGAPAPSSWQTQSEIIEAWRDWAVHNNKVIIITNRH